MPATAALQLAELDADFPPWTVLCSRVGHAANTTEHARDTHTLAPAHDFVRRRSGVLGEDRWLQYLLLPPDGPDGTVALAPPPFAFPSYCIFLPFLSLSLSGVSRERSPKKLICKATGG